MKGIRIPWLKFLAKETDPSRAMDLLRNCQGKRRGAHLIISVHLTASCSSMRRSLYWLRSMSTRAISTLVKRRRWAIGILSYRGGEHGSSNEKQEDKHMWLPSEVSIYHLGGDIIGTNDGRNGRLECQGSPHGVCHSSLQSCTLDELKGSGEKVHREQVLPAHGLTYPASASANVQ